MNDDKELQLLIGKCLHDEADEAEKEQLKKVLDESSEAFELYLKSIEQHNELKEWAQDYKEEVKDKKSFLYPVFYAAAAIIAVAFGIFYFSTDSELQLQVSKESNNYKVIRQGKSLSSPQRLQRGDQLIVGNNGQVKINIIGQDSQIYLLSNTNLKISNSKSNHFYLHQGEIRARLEPQKSHFLIDTADGQAEIVGTEFALSDKGKTKLRVSKGKVKMTAGTDDSVMVSAGHSIDSESFSLIKQAPEELLPKMYGGVRYHYYMLKGKDLSTMDKEHLIDRGICPDLTIFCGAYDGYVRGKPDSHSYVCTKPFAIVMKAYFQASASSATLRLTSLRESKLKVNGRLLQADNNGQFEVNFHEGMNDIEVQTIGGIEEDSGQVLVKLEKADASGVFREVSANKLFYSSISEPTDLGDVELSKSMTVQLPLNGDLVDRVSSQRALAFGDPQFTEDKRFGKVLQFDGRDDYLSHLPVDTLGLNGSYTVSTWLYLEDKVGESKHARAEQPLFSNYSGKINGSLVLLIRRKHPYHAHLHDDSISSKVLENGRWYHLAFRFYRDEQCIFIDGKQVMSSHGHGNLFSVENLEIGRWLGARFLKGKMHDLRVYNKPLSTNNILSIYEQSVK